MGGTKGVSGVGVVVSPEWESNIVNMTRVSARIMMIQFTVGKSVLKVIACYAPQQGLEMPEKVEFYDSLDQRFPNFFFVVPPIKKGTCWRTPPEICSKSLLE